ncbi:MAG TPA: hypothetical protein VIO60_02185 [Rectinemataceae bacterium]
MDPKAEAGRGIRITKRAFLASFIMLLALMILAGILATVLPSGSYERSGADAGFRVIPGSYEVREKPPYPAWRWLTAPFEVLVSGDGVQALVIIAFIMIVGGAFAILDKAGALAATVDYIAKRYSSRKYLLLALVSLFFMGIGALLGIFEETIPLVPLAIALAASLGWDVYVGLGMSILATGFGFSAAIANPFSIGTAQRLSGLPLFSGAGFRVLVFLAVYGILYAWLFFTARRSEGEPRDGAAHRMPGFVADPLPASIGIPRSASLSSHIDPSRGARVFGISFVFLILLIVVFAAVPRLSDFSMPLIALVFLASGLGSGLASGLGLRACTKAFLDGITGILPGVVLILMAMSVKYIIVAGAVMDSILHWAAGFVEGASGAKAAALIYLLTLGMNFFIGSATAKAFLLIPILAPLADLAGITRQVAVQAFAFGDGFSNMIYPTNAVLLISLGLAGVSWISWFKRTWLLQLFTLGLTLALLLAAQAAGYS